MPKKEQFYTTSNFLTASNAQRILIQGTKAANPVIPTGDTGKPDDTAMQNVSVFYDSDGAVFGTTGRLHCWYTGWRTKEYTPLDRATACYAYSDDMGVNWTKPVLNLVEVNGSTAHNGIRTGQIIATVNPNETYPLQALINFSGSAEYEYCHGRGATPTGIVENETTIRRTNADAWSLFYDAESNRYIHFHQIFFSDDGDFDTSAAISQFQRLFCIDYTDAIDGTWHYGNEATYLPFTVKTMGENKTAADSSNITTAHETYMGSGLISDTDITGTKYVLFAPNMYTRTTFNDFRGGTFVPGLAIMTDLTADDFTRVRGNTDDSILALGADTTWDDSMISMASNIIETETQWIGFYFAWDIKHEQFYPILNGGIISDHDVQIGRATWRRDGMTAVENTAATGTFVTATLTKVVGEFIYANYNGLVKAELLDPSTDAVITGYAVADCSLTRGDNQRVKVTWGANDASNLTSFKVKWYIYE